MTYNEETADYLRTKIGQTIQYIKWVVVRPSSLIDEERCIRVNKTKKGLCSN